MTYNVSEKVGEFFSMCICFVFYLLYIYAASISGLIVGTCESKKFSNIDCNAMLDLYSNCTALFPTPSSIDREKSKNFKNATK